jgi:hypothetical protein
MEVIQRRKRIEEWMGIELIAIGLRHEPNHSLGILNHMSIAINDRITFKSHNESSYSLFDQPARPDCQEQPPVFCG